MSITNEDIQTADLVLSKIGVSPEEYVVAKQASIIIKEPKENETSPYLSRREAADWLKVSTDTVDNLIAAGKLRSSKLSPARCGRVLVDRRSLETFVHQHTVRVRRSAK